MTERNWYFDGEYPEGDWLARSMLHDTTMYGEIADLREREGSDESISAGVMLLEVAAAVDDWFSEHPEEVYGYAPMLLSRDESNAVADAENDWYGIPGNSERQENLWHKEYLLRMGSAVTLLTDVGYSADGNASRHKMRFELTAHHPAFTGNEGLDLVYGALAGTTRDEFDIDETEGGVVVVRYSQCPPSSAFEPVIRQLVSIAS